MMLDAAKLLNRNFNHLADAGCRHLQIDEPYLTPPSDDEVREAVEALNLSIERLPEDMHVSVHVCQGNYAVGPHYDGQIGHRYFDMGRYKADLICQIECDSFMIEHDRTDAFKNFLGNKQLGVGAVDVQAPNVESPEEIVERVAAHRWLLPEQTIITSTCGFNHLPRHIAFGKMKTMTKAKAILTGDSR
jgi:5-methyltetrahydropteroyltriglutamate--homocysteine methyltransferase